MTYARNPNISDASDCGRFLECPAEVLPPSSASAAWHDYCAWSRGTVQPRCRYSPFHCHPCLTVGYELLRSLQDDICALKEVHGVNVLVTLNEAEELKSKMGNHALLQEASTQECSFFLTLSLEFRHCHSFPHARHGYSRRRRKVRYGTVQEINSHIHLSSS